AQVQTHLATAGSARQAFDFFRIPVQDRWVKIGSALPAHLIQKPLWLSPAAIFAEYIYNDWNCVRFGAAGQEKAEKPPFSHIDLFPAWTVPQNPCFPPESTR